MSGDVAAAIEGLGRMVEVEQYWPPIVRNQKDVRTLLAELERVRAERDALVTSIREALTFQSVLPAIATGPRRILTDALSALGDEGADQ